MRLTRGYLSGNYSTIEQKCDCLTSAELGFHEAINKLGQLEDIEEELGIDLAKFFKLIKSDELYVFDYETKDFCLCRNFNLCSGMSFSLYCEYTTHEGSPAFDFYKLKDYGKTWALTKEELL